MNKPFGIFLLCLFVLTAIIPNRASCLATLRIDFLPADTTLFSDFLPDYGDIYGLKDNGYTYGWNWELPHTTSMCKRNNSNEQPVYDTICQIRYLGKWEFQVQKGTYLVRVIIGDSNFDSIYTINIEGFTCAHDLPLPAGSFREVSLAVEVNDGKLTIDAGESPDLQTRIAAIYISSETPIIKSPPPEPGGLRINFQPPDSSVPGKYLADYGQLFGYKEGCVYPYGWSQDQTGAVRFRHRESDFFKDSLCMINNGSFWEMQVPNGSYTVTVCLGDPSYSNSYTLNVENVNYCNYEFIYAGDCFVKTMEVEVNDGRLTVDAGSSINTTRINYLEIRSPLLELDTKITRINFQPASFPTPAGYMPDSGEKFGPRVANFKYGWNLDHTFLTREYEYYPDPEKATLCHFLNQGKWEIEVPNGEYQVLVCIGDAVYNKTYTINVENINYWNKIPLQANQFIKLLKSVIVSDGHLTIDAGDSVDKETRINYIEIYQTKPALHINFQAVGVSVPNGFIGDYGDLFRLKEGCKYPFGWSRDHRNLVRNRSMEPDFLKDSLCHFHAGARWEIKLPNGKYLVTVCVGDASFSSTYTLNAENVNYWKETNIPAGQFLTETKEIYVNDGVLTLDSGYTTEIQTRINYIEIYSPLIEL